MSKVAVVFWSGTGNTETMANCIAEGARDAGAEVELVQINDAADFPPERVAEFDAIAFGCSSQGSEQLEESAFEPMFAALENNLAGKKVMLFGSYGWGDGQWMRDWHDRAVAAKAQLADEDFIVNETPDDDAQDTCRANGKYLANW